MWPPPRSFIAGTAAARHLERAPEVDVHRAPPLVERRSRSKVLRLPSWKALLTRTSTPPKDSTAVATAASHEAGSVMSRRDGLGLAPEGPHLVGHGLALLERAGAEHDVGAVLGEEQRDVAAHAGADARTRWRPCPRAATGGGTPACGPRARLLLVVDERGDLGGERGDLVAQLVGRAALERRPGPGRRPCRGRCAGRPRCVRPRPPSASASVQRPGQRADRERARRPGPPRRAARGRTSMPAAMPPFGRALRQPAVAPLGGPAHGRRATTRRPRSAGGPAPGGVGRRRRRTATACPWWLGNSSVEGGAHRVDGLVEQPAPLGERHAERLELALRRGPAPTPRIARPPESASSVAHALATTSGCR